VLLVAKGEALRPGIHWIVREEGSLRLASFEAGGPGHWQGGAAAGGRAK
jgi:hypothetical protein